MTNVVHILGVCLIVAGLIVGVFSWRHFRRPVPPASPPDPYSEPGSLFRPHTSHGRRP
jgi:hypothetical protein